MALFDKYIGEILIDNVFWTFNKETGEVISLIYNKDRSKIKVLNPNICGFCKNDLLNVDMNNLDGIEVAITNYIDAEDYVDRPLSTLNFVQNLYIFPKEIRRKMFKDVYEKNKKIINSKQIYSIQKMFNKYTTERIEKNKKIRKLFDKEKKEEAIIKNKTSSF